MLPLAFLGGCAGPTPTPTPPPEAAPAPEPAPAVEPTPASTAPPRAGESRVLRGVLRYTELPRHKSVEAFLGQDLTLSADGESWNLGATEQVTQEQLVALDGQRIEVTATYVPPTAPDPNMQAPMDGDELMKHPARWDVTAVRVVGEAEEPQSAEPAPKPGLVERYQEAKRQSVCVEAVMIAMAVETYRMINPGKCPPNVQTLVGAKIMPKVPDSAPSWSIACLETEVIVSAPGRDERLGTGDDVAHSSARPTCD